VPAARSSWSRSHGSLVAAAENFCASPLEYVAEQPGALEGVRHDLVDEHDRP
jgi:hypothetical protein